MENETKEKILSCSLELFARDGYEAVSVRDIAEKLGISKGALYKHYLSKRDIFDCILARMEQQDMARAESYEMPTENGGTHSAAKLGNLLNYTEAQFRYWTEEPFSSQFRRMLTLEQYRSPEMSELFQNYLCRGPLEYVTEIFFRIFGNEEKARALAMDFYAPVFAIYFLWDGETDKRKIMRMLSEHISCFEKRLGEKI